MMINFGIDLGTTNSVFARYQEGNVEIFKNPIGHKETLPSVVGFRNERILIGDKAREYLEKDPRNVFGSFKRKMGTDESYWVESIQQVKTPVDLSAMVLKELRNFIYTGEIPDSIVITVPASFDTIQSNATKEAGYQAGFGEVLLLQEPIAASLAFVNKTTEKTDRKWLVYDLGGGTFDLALVETKYGEMKVIDHEGDNFLGGLDFDNRIISRIIIPYLDRIAAFENLDHDLHSSGGKYNKLYYVLQKKAEEVKLTLSAALTASIEFEIELPDGSTKEVYFDITRAEFENVIRDLVIRTIDIVRLVLERNELQPNELNCILLVGGSTFTPCVREWIAQELDIIVSTAIDPTTAIAAGAAYFAGTKRKQFISPAKPANFQDLSIKTGYAKVSQDTEEYFVAEATGKIDNLQYRLTRADGGYDTGLRQFNSRITEFLQLLPQANNQFELRIFDAQQQLVYHDSSIQIVSGKYGILGQPLPHDICIEVDDKENNTTKLELVFARNSSLPLKTTLTKSVSKTIHTASGDSIVINILEGNQGAIPSSNLSIGIIEIKGDQLSVDLVKGSDIEITLEMSESRDLRVTTYLMMSDQEFTNLFTPSARHVNINKLLDEIKGLHFAVTQEIRAANIREEYEVSQRLSALINTLNDAEAEARTIAVDDVTDRKYQLDDKKKFVAAQMDMLTRDKLKMSAKLDYFNTRNKAQDVLVSHGNDEEKTRFSNLLKQEKQILSGDTTPAIESLTTQIRKIINPIYFRTPAYLISIYHYYASLDEYPDASEAASLKDKGDRSIANSNYEELRYIINKLHTLLPRKEQEKANIKGTGIS